MKTKPIILDYAVEQAYDLTPLYQYDFNESINVVTVGGKKIPFIDGDSKMIEMATVTKSKECSDNATICWNL
jgi:hypothetical protein